VPLRGYEGLYEIEVDSRLVRSCDRVITDVRGRERRWRGRVLRLSASGNRPLKCTLSRNGEHVTFYPHTVTL
jgi:hypothetical protein